MANPVGYIMNRARGAIVSAGARVAKSAVVAGMRSGLTQDGGQDEASIEALLVNRLTEIDKALVEQNQLLKSPLKSDQDSALGEMDALYEEQADIAEKQSDIITDQIDDLLEALKDKNLQPLQKENIESLLEDKKKEWERNRQLSKGSKEIADIVDAEGNVVKEGGSFTYDKMAQLKTNLGGTPGDVEGAWNKTFEDRPYQAGQSLPIDALGRELTHKLIETNDKFIVDFTDRVASTDAKLKDKSGEYLKLQQSYALEADEEMRTLMGEKLTALQDEIKQTNKTLKSSEQLLEETREQSEDWRNQYTEQFTEYAEDMTEEEATKSKWEKGETDKLKGAGMGFGLGSMLSGLMRKTGLAKGLSGVGTKVSGMLGIPGIKESFAKSKLGGLKTLAGSNLARVGGGAAFAGLTLHDIMKKGGAKEQFQEGKYLGAGMTALAGTSAKGESGVDTAKGIAKQAVKWGGLGLAIGGPVGAAIGASIGAGVKTLKSGFEQEWDKNIDKTGERIKKLLSDPKKGLGAKIAGTLGEGFKTLFAPIIGGIRAVFDGVKDKFADMTAIFQSSGSLGDRLVEMAKTGMRAIFELPFNLLKGIVNTVGKLFGSKDIVSKLFSKGSILGRIKDWVSGVGDWLIDVLLSPFKETFKFIIKKVQNIFKIAKSKESIGKKVGKIVWESVTLVLGGVFKWFKGQFFDLPKTIIKGLWKYGKKGAGLWVDINKAIINGYKAIITGLVNLFKKIFTKENIKNVLYGAWKQVAKFTVHASKFATDFISGIVTGFKDTFAQIKEKIITALNFVKPLWKKLKGLFISVVDSVGESLSGENITSLIKKIPAMMKGVVTSIVDKIKGIFSKIINWVTDIVSIKGFRKAWAEGISEATAEIGEEAKGPTPAEREEEIFRIKKKNEEKLSLQKKQEAEAERARKQAEVGGDYLKDVFTMFGKQESQKIQNNLRIVMKENKATAPRDSSLAYLNR